MKRKPGRSGALRHHGKPWSAWQVTHLRKVLRTSGDLRQIARRMGRTPSPVVRMARDLGWGYLLPPRG